MLENTSDAKKQITKTTETSIILVVKIVISPLHTAAFGCE